MYYYLIYGLRIQSDYEFEEAFEIPRLSDTEVDVVIKQEILLHLKKEVVLHLCQI